MQQKDGLKKDKDMNMPQGGSGNVGSQSGRSDLGNPGSTGSQDTGSSYGTGRDDVSGGSRDVPVSGKSDLGRDKDRDRDKDRGTGEEL
ncbi:MAG TPA: hypothetical protein VII13_02860 [Vicinamibacteria bacterium]